MHGINNVRISKLYFKELASKYLEVYYRICSHFQTPFDYSVWSYFKRKIYVSLPRHIAELDQNIREELAQIIKEIKWAGRYGLDGPGIEIRWGRDFPHLSRQALGPSQPSMQWIPGLSRR